MSGSSKLYFTVTVIGYERTVARSAEGVARNHLTGVCCRDEPDNGAIILPVTEVTVQL